MNPGGIRADLPFNAPNGDVTYNDLFTVQPFANTLVVKTMTGAQIKALLEQQFDNPTAGQKRILQVSAGFTYSYDTTQPPGSRVERDPARRRGDRSRSELPRDDELVPRHRRRRLHGLQRGHRPARRRRRHRRARGLHRHPLAGRPGPQNRIVQTG